MSFLRDRSNRLRLGGYVVLTAGAAVVLTFGLLSIFHSASASSSVARTVTVEVGTVASSVSASGNVSPSASDSVNFADRWNSHGGRRGCRRQGQGRTGTGQDRPDRRRRRSSVGAGHSSGSRDGSCGCRGWRDDRPARTEHCEHDLFGAPAHDRPRAADHRPDDSLSSRGGAFERRGARMPGWYFEPVLDGLGLRLG